MTSTKAREAFDLTKEPMKVRERYGMTRFGQSCLLARRPAWRPASGLSPSTRSSLCLMKSPGTSTAQNPLPHIAGYEGPGRADAYDQGYSALIEDLSATRHGWTTRMVCNLAEFGRTPKINPAGGRDHWPQCWTVYFAGRRRQRREDRWQER